jgi:hypothetical protein
MVEYNAPKNKNKMSHLPFSNFRASKYDKKKPNNGRKTSLMKMYALNVFPKIRNRGALMYKYKGPYSQ